MKKLWILLVMVLTGSVLAATPASASTKYVVTKEATWLSVRTWTAPNNVGTGTHLEQVLISVTVDYLFWKNTPDGIYRIAPYLTQNCYNLQDGGSLFQGERIRAYYFDDDTDALQDWIQVDDAGDHKCRTEALPVADRNWYRMDQSPGWQVDGNLQLKFTRDQNWQFMWSGSQTKFFHPADDPNIGDWYYEDNANWGG